MKSFFGKLFGAKDKGSVSIDWNIINPIAPAEYRFIVERQIPTVTINVNSSWDQPVADFEANVRLQEVSDWVSQSLDEVSGAKKLEIVLPLPEEKLYGHEERPVIFEIKCKYKEPSGKLREYSDTKVARVLSKDDMIWSIKRGRRTRT